MAEQTSKLIQHIGIVAGICKEVKLIEEIDKQIPKEKRSVSVGQAVQAMILNNIDAYLFPVRVIFLNSVFRIFQPIKNRQTSAFPFCVVHRESEKMFIFFRLFNRPVEGRLVNLYLILSAAN